MCFSVISALWLNNQLLYESFTYMRTYLQITHFLGLQVKGQGWLMASVYIIVP